MWEALINNLGKYTPLTLEEIDIVQSLFTFKKYRKKQYILQEGDVMRYENFISKGITRMYEVDEKGQEHVVHFGLEDWWVGDLYSFLTETASIYNIDCIEDVELFQINKEKLESLYEQVPKIERHFRLMIQNAYIATTRRLSSTLAKSAKEQYDEFIAKYPQVEQRVANHQIASYLGITPQSLSRIRAQGNSK